MNVSSRFAKLDGLLAALGSPLQSVLLLILRLWWGWQFFVAGKGKLLDLEKPTAFFIELGIPLPKLNAILAGSTECFGGLLLMAGLCSRVASVPLIFTMVVAYATAHRGELVGIFASPDDFTGATPFLFLLTSLVVFAFGPGKLSLDHVLFRKKPER